MRYYSHFRNTSPQPVRSIHSDDLIYPEDLMSLPRSCFPDEKEFTSDAETDCKPPKTELVSDAEEGNTGAPCQLKADCYGCGEDQPNKTSAEVWPVIDELHQDNKDHQVFRTPSTSPAASDDDDECYVTAMIFRPCFGVRMFFRVYFSL